MSIGPHRAASHSCVLLLRVRKDRHKFLYFDSFDITPLFLLHFIIRAHVIISVRWKHLTYFIRYSLLGLQVASTPLLTILAIINHAFHQLSLTDNNFIGSCSCPCTFGTWLMAKIFYFDMPNQFPRNIFTDLRHAWRIFWLVCALLPLPISYDLQSLRHAPYWFYYDCKIRLDSLWFFPRN